MHGNEIGKKQENSFFLVSPHPEPWKRRPQLELWKHFSMTEGSGTGLEQIKSPIHLHPAGPLQDVTLADG